MFRRDLTGREWVAVQPPLPNRPRGVPRVGNRRALVDSSIMHARQHAEGGKRGACHASRQLKALRLALSYNRVEKCARHLICN